MRKFKLLFGFLMMVTVAQTNDIEARKQIIHAELEEICQALGVVNEILTLSPKGVGEVVISHEILKYFPIAWLATFLNKHKKARIIGVVLPLGYVFKVALDKATYHVLIFVKQELEGKKRQLEWQLRSLPKNL